MRKRIIILLLPLFALAASFPSDFEVEVKEALHFIHQHQSAIQTAERQFDVPKEEMLAVVAPELLRYSLFRDLLETTALELAYVQYGSQMADFSIGPFQMKPSFAEAIEEYLLSQEQLSECYGNWINYQQKDKRQIRRERLARLESLEGQLHYAFLYCLMMQDCYNTAAFLTDTDKIRFWATAYNCGFTRSYDDLIQRMDRPIFPYGADFDIPQFSYADWSTAFYRHLLQRP